jgi:hypothetical protein
MSWPRDRFTGPGGGLFTGPGGGLFTGPGGGLWTGPGGHYHSNQPPREALLEVLAERGMTEILSLLERAGF